MQIPIRFEGIRGVCFYEGVKFRAPKKGEFYLSGGPPSAWRAPNDLSMTFLVVRPTFRAVPTGSYRRGKAIVLTETE